MMQMRLKPILLPLVATLVVSVSVLSQTPEARHANGKLQLHFINVGEGDAALLISPNGETVMFDNGVVHQCHKPLSYLQQLGVPRIDYQIFSHYHADHIGCTSDLYSELPLTHALYDRGPSYHGDVYNSYLIAVGSKRQTATDQTTITLDKGSAQPVTIRIVAMNGNGIKTSNEDGLSLVSVVTFGPFKAVIGGDLTGFTDNEYVDVESSVAAKVGQVDVYKVHDHGSRYASSDAWLDAVRPRIGIVSTGNDNRKGHPSEESIERLHRASVKTYWTETGNGVEPELGMDKVGGNIIVEVAPKATIYTVRTASGSQTVDQYAIWEAGSTSTMTGLSHVQMPVAAAGLLYGWSKRAEVYHFVNCRYMASVDPDHLETSTMPPAGKVLHKGCPR